MNVRIVALIAALLPGLPAQAADVTLTGAGSTFAAPILSAWASRYALDSGTKVNYQAVGSGTGMTLIRSGTVDFAASDMPLPPGDLAHSRLAQFPLVIGGIVPVVNIEGVGPGALRFTGPLLADIFLGTVRRWNDPAIRELNEAVALPDADITVVHRTDGSGTTFNWTHYLGSVSAEWRNGPGEGPTVQWPSGIGGKGNEGVAARVRQTPNSIGYVELSQALAAHLAYAEVRNPAGVFVRPSAESIAAAAATADWKSATDFYLMLTSAPGKDAWPIAATTFAVVAREPTKPDRHQATLAFFRWALEHGQDQASALGYVPLPDALVRRVEASWPARH